MGRGKQRMKQVRRTKMSAYERLQWARKEWLEDPAIPVQGDDGMIRRMKRVFNVAASTQVLYDLREGVQKEVAKKAKEERERKAMARKLEVDDRPRVAAKSVVTKRLITSPPKSAPVASADSPPPAPVVEIPPADSPPMPARRGRTSNAKFKERELYGLQQLRLRPHMPISGPDGLNDIIRARFGRGMSHHHLKALKDQVQAELKEPETLKSIMSAMPTKKEEPREVPREEPREEPREVPREEPRKPASSSDVTSAIRTAAELIMDSIPNLKEFSLTVDEKGKVSVDYKQYILEVGSITLE